MLAAAVATFLLTYAHTYPQFLVAALGVGIAGGSFAVGIAYVSRWYPTGEAGHRARHLRRRQCRRRGHQVLRALRAGRLRLADGRAGLGGRRSRSWRVVFWFTTKDDPVVDGAPRQGRTAAQRLARARAAEEHPGLALLALLFLRLRRLRRAVAVAAALPDRRLRPRHRDRRHDRRRLSRSRPACSAPMAAISSDRYGARRIMYWTFGVSVAATFVLSYPPTDYVVQGIKGPIAASTWRPASSPSPCLSSCSASS